MFDVHNGISAAKGTTCSDTTLTLSGIAVAFWSVVLLAVLITTGFASFSSLGVMGELGVEASLISAGSVFTETEVSLVRVSLFSSSKY